MKVNAINSYKFNNVHFEGKKSKQDNRIMNTTTPIKAVPVIVLMAMSPLNAPLMNAKPVVSAEPQTEISAKQEKVVATAEYPNATPNKNMGCTIYFISNDGDDNSAEKVQMVFNIKDNLYDNKKLAAVRSETKVVEMKTIRKRHILNISEGGVETHMDAYFLEGPGYNIVSISKLNGEIVSRKTDMKDNQMISITKQFYEDLKGLSDDSLKIIEEDVVDNEADYLDYLY